MLFTAVTENQEYQGFWIFFVLILIALIFVHKHYRRNPKPPQTRLGKIWRSIETNMMEMPESTSEREVRDLLEKQKQEAEQGARNLLEKQNREAWEAQEKHKREVRDAREKQEREERYEREKPERMATILRQESERKERLQARRLERQARSAARRARRKEMKDKEKELARLAMEETAPPDKLSETIADPITNQPVRKRRSDSFSREDLSSIADPSPAGEGKRILRTNYAVVRNSTLRKIAIHIHGRNCIVCGFNFDQAFGEDLAQGYIEVHHLKSIARGERSTDAEKDLVPLCANCHAMADRLSSRHESPPSSISELRRLLRPTSGQSEVPSPDEVGLR